MTAAELYKAGQLTAAIDAQIQEVKAKPADQGKRLFLFELCCFAGDLDRARRQIDVLKFEELEVEAAARSYKGLLDAELARRKFFADGVEPKFLMAIPEHVSWRLEAVKSLRSNLPAEAVDFLTKAEGARPALHGTFNGKAFTSIRDCDDLFGDVLEVMANGNYFWVPLEQVESIALTPPRFPRDLLWRAARLETRESAGDVFLPVLYPGSHTHQEDQIKLGRATDWSGGDSAPTRGAGTHMFLVDDDGASLLEWQELHIEMK
jgi:type VI secretion system protein ImpE